MSRETESALKNISLTRRFAYNFTSKRMSKEDLQTGLPADWPSFSKTESPNLFSEEQETAHFKLANRLIANTVHSKQGLKRVDRTRSIR